MLTDDERIVCDHLRAARDAANLLDDPAPVYEAVTAALDALFARAGRRDEDNVEQAAYLAEQVVLLTDAVTPARVRGATATAKQLVDGSLSIAVKVPPVPEDEPVPEAAPDGEASP